jgi:hypothetical protein
LLLHQLLRILRHSLQLLLLLLQQLRAQAFAGRQRAPRAGVGLVQRLLPASQ